MNLHSPERQQGETQQKYRERRAAARKAARAITGHGLGGGVGSRQALRDEMRKSGTMGKRTRAYVALMAAWAAKRVTKAKLRDENGAITFVGKPYELIGVKPSSREFVIEGGSDHGERFYTVRRVWLAGVSAQRGY